MYKMPKKGVREGEKVGNHWYSQLHHDNFIANILPIFLRCLQIYHHFAEDHEMFFSPTSIPFPCLCLASIANLFSFLPMPVPQEIFSLFANVFLERAYFVLVWWMQRHLATSMFIVKVSLADVKIEIIR